MAGRVPQLPTAAALAAAAHRRPSVRQLFNKLIAYAKTPFHGRYALVDDGVTLTEAASMSRPSVQQPHRKSDFAVILREEGCGGGFQLPPLTPPGT
ncbi:hypothetical protein Q1695_013275 [Nippostrongylus brasiliensis]|nr:hypothetical protein Q1695_013275 [Nippostrongylus brasiliensis]